MNVISQSTVFAEWLSRLADAEGRGVILARIEAAKLGNFGDVEPVGDGVSEMRIHFGPGYRVYFMREGFVLYLLLCGGNKSTQRGDIKNARSMANQVREVARATAMANKEAGKAKSKTVGQSKSKAPMKAQGKSKGSGKSQKG